MKLNEVELKEIRRFLSGETPDISVSLLEKVEIGFWMFSPLQVDVSFGFSNIHVRRPYVVMGQFGAAESLRIIRLFTIREFPYLLVRTDSYECYINCNGEVLTDHCDEDLDSIRDACERLRERCPDGGHPSVRVD
jgi:hypothetical protein